MKVEFEYVKDSKRNTFTLPRHPSPRQHNSILKHLQCWRFLQEELRACEWVPRFLSYEGCCQRRPLASCSIQNTEMCYMTKGWGGARRRAARAIKGPKGIHILLTTMKTVSGISTTSHWGCLICKSQLDNRYPQHCIAHPHTPLPSCGRLFVHAPKGSECLPL